MVAMDIFTPIYVLAIIFLFISFIYSSVGLGGGSSYTALMAIFSISAVAIPLVSLSLNLIVTTFGSYNFIRNKHANVKLILPFLVSSMPMAYLGGTFQLDKGVFYWILLISLIIVALRLYVWSNVSLQLQLSTRGRISLSLIAGGVIGLLAGIVGIGGGIYLVPIIIILGLGTEKQAAACGAIFIWLNSLAGFVSRVQYNAINFMDYLPLIVAVIIGGAVGSYLGSFKYSAKTMDKLLGVVVLVAIIFLIKKIAV